MNKIELLPKNHEEYSIFYADAYENKGVSEWRIYDSDGDYEYFADQNEANTYLTLLNETYLKVFNKLAEEFNSKAANE